MSNGLSLQVLSGDHGHAHGGHGHAHGGHGHAHDEPQANPAHKWSKAANTPPEEDMTLDEEGIDYDNIETIVGHGHAHASHEAHGGHGHAHGGGGGGHGHSHGPPQKEPSRAERSVLIS